ncbi:unnamed protein product [Heterobilharzia americana]|nr:unnamed protein product [Heterobilharzia americana]
MPMLFSPSNDDCVCCSCTTCIFSDAIRIGQCILNSWCREDIKSFLIKLMNAPHVYALRHDIFKLVELNRSKDSVYSDMRLYGCMNQYFSFDKRKVISPEIKDDVEKHVINYLSYIPPVYRKLFVLYILFGTDTSVAHSVYCELRKKFLTENNSPAENSSSFIHIPWNLSSKIESFLRKRDEKHEKYTKYSKSSNELQCTCDDLQEWDDLIRQSWESLSSKIRQAYTKIKVRYVLMLERNIYCGPFSIYVLLERQPNNPLCKRRVIHTDDKTPWLAYCDGSSQQRTIKFLDITIKSFRENESTKRIRKKNDNNNQFNCKSDFMAHLNRVWLTGHAGSVRTLWLDTQLQLLLSGSYDTSIRLWNLSEDKQEENFNSYINNISQKMNSVSFRNSQSKCIRIYHGHTDTVLCIWLDQSKLWPKINNTKRIKLSSSSSSSSSFYHPIDYNQKSNNHNNQSNNTKKSDFQATYQFASGSVDCTCCVWRLDERKPLWTMKHATAVTAVGLRGFICTAGERNGRVNVWRIGCKKPTLLKVLNEHTGCITALRFDNYHLVTSSKDKFVRIWSMIGEFTECLGTLMHTGEVLCVELIDLRIITGCSDGRIRVWNLLTQHCQRILPGNYRHDPIISIMPLENRLIVNTQHNILALNFDVVKWEYHESTTDKAEELWLKELMNSKRVLSLSRSSSQSRLSYAESRYLRSRLVGSADPRFFRQPVNKSKDNVSANRRSSSGNSYFNRTSSVKTQLSEKLDHASFHSSQDKSKSEPIEFLISPPIPGTYAAKHRKINDKLPNTKNSIHQTIDDNRLKNCSRYPTQHYCYFQSPQNVNQFKCNLLKQIHTLKRNQLNKNKKNEIFNYDFNTQYNNTNEDKQLEQIYDLPDYNYEQSYKNSQSIKRLRSKSATPDISMELMSTNEAREILSQSNIIIDNFNQQNEYNTIDLNSIQLPQPIVS